MMESELDILRDVSGRLESAGIAFMLTGSVAMNYDVRNLLSPDCDVVYLHSQAPKLGVEELLREVLASDE